MSTVVTGAKTTETVKAVGVKHELVNIQEKLANEAAVEKPVVYISTKGADGAFLRSPAPLYDANGNQRGMDNGVRIDFTNGLSDPYYKSNPIHRQQIEAIDEIIEEGYPIVADLGLEKMKPGQPQPPLVKWNHLDAAGIRAALAANFGSSFVDNVAVLEQGIRYELSRPKKDQRKTVISTLEAMVALEAAEDTDADALDVQA